MSQDQVRRAIVRNEMAFAVLIDRTQPPSEYPTTMCRKMLLDSLACDPCACGKMRPPDVKPIGLASVERFDDDQIRVSITTMCNVCGHRERKTAMVYVDDRGNARPGINPKTIVDLSSAPRYDCTEKV